MYRCRLFVIIDARNISPIIYTSDKALRRSSPTILRKSVLTCCKAEFAFFSIWVFFHEYLQFSGQQRKGEAISLYPFCHYHLLHKYLDISRVIAAENSPLCKTSSRNRTGNLWFLNASYWPSSYALFRIHSLYTCTDSCCC